MLSKFIEVEFTERTFGAVAKFSSSIDNSEFRTNHDGMP